MDNVLELSDPHCLPAPELARLLAGAPWRRLVVLGDSIASGVGDPATGYDDRCWADRLAVALRAAVGSVGYLNLGVRGLGASEIRRTQLRRALAFRPDLVVVAAGANDAMRRDFDPAVVSAELDDMLGSLRAVGCLPVTFGVLDLSRTGLVGAERRQGLHDRLRALNAVTREVTGRHHGCFVDFFEHPGQDGALFSADRIHPNRRGHAHIATSVVRSLAELATHPTQIRVGSVAGSSLG